jgi:hypothetical protein
MEVDLTQHERLDWEEELRMKRAGWVCTSMSLLAWCSAAWADLAGEFSGFTWVQENKVSGLTSSVNTNLPTSMFTLGPGRVSYPSGIGTVPSPGSYNWGEAAAFDEGGLGFQVRGGNLVVQAAGGINPQTGYWSTSWGQYYGQGDVFLTVRDSTGVKNFALLSSWARDPSSGAVRSLDGGTYFYGVIPASLKNL